jgi:hypothetical protein
MPRDSTKQFSSNLAENHHYASKKARMQANFPCCKLPSFLPSSKPKPRMEYLTSERKRHKQNKTKQNKREGKWRHTYLYKTAFVQARERR